MLNQNPSTFTWNGHSSDEFGIRIERKPDLSRSARKFKSASVAGRNGNIYQLQNAWEEVVVSYDIFAGGKEKGDAITDFTAIMEWLNSADDYAVLSDSYDPSHYRLAVFVDAVDIESQWYTIGQATVKFRCRPQRYIVQSDIAVQDGDTVTNTTNHTALPIITLAGSGAHSLYQVDKPVNDVNNGGFMSYTPRLENYLGWVSYGNNDGVPAYSFYSADYAASKGASVTTHSDSTGTLSFTSFNSYSGAPYFGFGTALSVNPNTDYTISCGVNAGQSKINVTFFQSSGAMRIINSAEVARSGAGTLTLSFHTPAECGKAMIGFYKTDGSAGTFSNIMLATGQEAQPFRGYVGDNPNTITVGNTTLQFSVNGFGTAVIDCERENLTVDGSNSNATSSVLDQYGNISEEYLKLKSGNNTITYSSDITSVTIEPRLWEL